MSSPASRLPVADPCLSFWQQTTRSFPHLHANEHTPVPPAATHVIIGSGMAGALVAYRLIEAGVPGPEIVLLEAREAVSGASSRNSGHVRPDAFRGFQVYERLHGTDEALRIIQNERTVFETVRAFVQQHGLQSTVDFADRSTMEACLDPAFVRFNAEAFAAFQAAGGDVSHIRYYDETEAPTKTGVARALCAYEWPAGSVHPAKLAHWLLTQSIDKGVRLFTHCPATSVTPSGPSGPSSSAPARWNVATPRGTIATSTVVHCTNAYAAHLLPQLAGFIRPKVQQSHAFVPPASLSGDKRLVSTVSLRHGLQHFYSVNQRPSDGMLILGSATASPNVSKATYEAQWSANDALTFADVQADTLANLQSCFPACRADALRPGEGLLHAWTGICAMMPDLVPLVGPVEGAPGQWICAGFHAHGMARIFTCATGVANMMLGASWESTGLPACFQMMPKRLDKYRNASRVRAKV